MKKTKPRPSTKPMKQSRPAKLNARLDAQRRKLLGKHYAAKYRAR